MVYNRMLFWGISLLAVLTLASCETVIFEEEKTAAGETEPGTLVISVVGTESYNNQGTRAPIDVTKTCTRLCFAIYQDDKRVKSVNQKVGDSDFGTATFKQLEAGQYQVLILGHNSTGNPSTTNPLKIQFTNATASGGTGFSDTFYYYGDLDFDGETANQSEFTLTRATAMFRLVLKDPKPESVRRFYFYYTGGSGTLDATTGYGCVNSKQNAIFETGSELDGKPLTFELYTFPHEEDDEVTFTVKALDAKDDVVVEREFKNVWMRRNNITQYSGNFFSTGNDDDTPTPDDPHVTPPSPAVPWTILADTVWAAVNMFSF